MALYLVNDLLPIEKIDEALLRFILDAHAKAPIETLYLESGAIPIRFIIANRRINYLQTLLKRDDKELTKKILKAQLKNTSEGDFAQLVKSDFEQIKLPFDLKVIENTGMQTFKSLIKSKVKEAAFNYLNMKLENHSKVKDIKYSKLETQKYLTSQLFTNKETSLLFGLRTKTARTFKANFSNLYGGKIACPLNCWNTKYNELAPPDNQEHLLLCENIKLSSNNISRSKTEYSNLFGDIIKQKEIITLFTELLEERHKSLNEAEDPPGDNLEPSTSSSKCCKSTKFTHSIICNDGIFIENK